MKNSRPKMFPGLDLTGKHHVSSIDSIQGRERCDKNRAHRLISTDFRVILNVTFNIRVPNDWVIIRLEESCDIFSPRFDGLESVLAKDTRQVSLNSGDSSSSEVITEDAKCRDGLATRVRASENCR